ncbi:lipopolysaccharide assembly LapA domain-containing protein [Corynebacterium sp. YSMAA1_1_D6]|uniref:LapA family protein n=1 Tax=unclassified Corynebacterium TaxID=2624378 RepID=UPI0027B9826A|nr:lipopolysaccharide assembly protein LapA domain-containing protein [Corynebacterium sp.]
MTNPEKHSADLPADGTTPETTDYTTASETAYSAPDATTPDTTGAVETAPSSVEYDTTRDESGKVKGSFAASTWIALIVGFLLLIVLIIFILQNQHEVPMNFLNWSVEFPAGVTYLICAIAGALIMALVGGWRMIELRRQVRKQGHR